MAADTPSKQKGVQRKVAEAANKVKDTKQKAFGKYRKLFLFHYFVKTIYFLIFKASQPAYLAEDPSSSSIRNNWLYFATRSDLAGAPVLI